MSTFSVQQLLFLSASLLIYKTLSKLDNSVHGLPSTFISSILLNPYY